MTDTSIQALNQQLSLKILTGDIDSSAFEAKNASWIVIPKIGEQISSLLISSSDPKCSLSSTFSPVDKYWCRYNRLALCNGRTSCEFITGVGNGCQKKQSQSGCAYGDQTSCEANTQCEWTVSSNTCTRKPEELDCNGLVLQQSCNNR